MIIKPMSFPALQELLGWAADEGWNPGLDDAEAFFKVDPDGFLMACDAEKLIAGIAVVKYDTRNGFLGLYICHPDYRGKGTGLNLWNAGMRYLDGFSVGLDGVVAQQENYRKSGFEFAYRNVRYSGVVKTENLQAVSTEGDISETCIYRSINENDLPAIKQLDHSIHGFNRQRMIDHWLMDTEHRKSLVCIDQQEVIGFGTIRKCQQGSKIGPLIANNPAVAQSLLTKLINKTDSREIVLDVPEPNRNAIRLATGFGLTPGFETARMYRGSPPDYQLDNLYGVTTFELG